VNGTGRLLNKCALYSYLSDADGKPAGETGTQSPTVSAIERANIVETARLVHLVVWQQCVSLGTEEV